MKALFFGVLFLSSNVFAASVQSVTESQPVCFGREYSQAHMDKTPLQTVKKMSVKFRKTEPGADYLIMDIEASVKTTKTETYDGETFTHEVYKSYKNGMVCNKTRQTTMECYIECDGGRAGITWDAATASQKITFMNSGFMLYGGCGEGEEDMDNWLWLESVKGGNDIFNLYALPPEYCQN